MNSVFRELQKLPEILRRKLLNKWQRQLCKQNITPARFRLESNRNRADKRFMWENFKYTASGGLNIGSPNSTRTNYRHWEPMESHCSGKSTSQSELQFKVVSYNILAQDLLVEHLQLYRLCNEIHLRWSHRLSKLTEEILAQRPDVLCLQEVQENHLAELIAKIQNKLPLQCVFKKKTGPKTDGCAVFYNKNLFEVVGLQEVEYYQPRFELLDRHNIALITKLRCKYKPNVTFLVCTTHLLYNPRRQDVRVAQLMVLLAELDRCSVIATTKCGLRRMPIILTGDFNFEPCSAPFELIATGKLKYEELSSKTLTKGAQPYTGKKLLSPRLGITDNCQHLECVHSNYRNCTSGLYEQKHSERYSDCEQRSDLFSTGTLSHDLNLKSVYNHCREASFGSTFQNKWITVDHLFYSDCAADQTNDQQGSLKLLSTYQLPTVKECHKLGNLPNAEHGSDHLMLGGLFSVH